MAGDTTGNITGVDPQLGLLANNGGPTQTHALLTGSPAVNNGCDPYGTYSSLAAGQTISVKVQKGFTLFTPVISSFMGQPVTVSATAKVRVQG